MALLGGPKIWVVSGELSAFGPTFFFYLKVKWREVRIPAFAERDQRPVALGYRLPRRRERRSDASVRPLLTSGPGKRACGLILLQALDRGERTGRIACKIIPCIRIGLMCRPRPSIHASCSRRASLCMEAAAFVRLPTASVPLNTRAPLVRDLTSVPAARPTMGWHGKPSSRCCRAL